MPIIHKDGVEVEVTEAQLEAMNGPYEGPSSTIRERRDRLIAETDWWAGSDRTMTQAEIDYRQALRDVPTQAGFPENVTWPTKP